MINPKFSKGIQTAFASLLLIFMIIVNSTVLYASGADITFKTEGESNDPQVVVELGGILPTPIASFTLEVNYNNQAFQFVEADTSLHDGFSLNYEDQGEGILLIEGQSDGDLLYEGEQVIASFTLEAIEPGVATIALINSTFKTPDGQKVPGTVLRYFVISKDFQKETTLESTSSEEPTTSASTEPSTTPSVTTSDTSTVTSSTVPTSTQSSEESSSSSTSDTTLSTPSSSTDDTPENSGPNTKTVILIVVPFAIIVLSLIYVLLKRRTKK
jgi:hypothetical protein